MDELSPGPLFKPRTWWYRFVMLFIKLLTVVLPAPRPMLLVGRASAVELCRMIVRFGHRHVFLVTDEMLVKLDFVTRLKGELEARDIEVTVFDKVQPDPAFETVDEGAALLREKGCDAVLAIGGGSPMDAAKVIAACVTSARPARKLSGILKLKAPTLPLYVIPTTAGTGSEMTLAAVLSDHAEQVKEPIVDPRLVPSAAALDPELMLGLPSAVTAASGMDAMTHAVESYLSRHASPETDRLALAAVRLIAEYLPRCYEQGDDLAAREAMAIAANYAGSAFTKANVGYVHAVAHQFGARYHTPHGLANAMVMPYVLDYSKPAVTGRLADLARAAGLGGEGDEQLADAFIVFIRSLNERLGIPAELEALRPADIPEIARGALKEAHYLYPVPRYMDRRCCEALVRRMLPETASTGEQSASTDQAA